MSSESFERQETYSWARRNGLHDPYGFAIHFEHLWGSKEELIGRARSWETDQLLDHKGRLEDEMDELRRKIETADANLERAQTREFR